MTCIRSLHLKYTLSLKLSYLWRCNVWLAYCFRRFEALFSLTVVFFVACVGVWLVVCCFFLNKPGWIVLTYRKISKKCISLHLRLFHLVLGDQSNTKLKDSEGIRKNRNVNSNENLWKRIHLLDILLAFSSRTQHFWHLKYVCLKKQENIISFMQRQKLT